MTTPGQPWQKPSIPFARQIMILSICSAFAPFATDMYLPGFSKLITSFATDASHIEATISFFFLGLAVGQVIYGPLIDRFGRRRPLLAGISLFILATAGCLMVTDIQSFIALRLLQALGGCSGMIIGRAIVSSLIAASQNGTPYPMTIAIGSCGFLACLLWFVFRAFSLRATAHAANPVARQNGG